SGRLRVGHGLLHQSNAAGRVGEVLARSKNSHSRGEKLKICRSKVAGGCPKSSGRFAILRDSARYPSGPRERSAKPPFVGSNPTRASKLLRSLCKSGDPVASFKLNHFFRF